MATRTAWAGTVVDGEIADQTDFNSLPGGWLGYVETTTNQTGITTDTDLTTMTLTVVLPADRMLKITAKIPVSSATADDRVGISVKEGATVLSGDQTTTPEVNRPYTLTAVAVIDGPSAGSHTYKVSAGLGGVAVGPMRTDHASSGRSFLLIEDIGPAS